MKTTTDTCEKKPLKLIRAFGKASKYAVVIEESENGFGAYVPVLPGCVAVAKTRKEVWMEILKAIDFHIEGMRLYGEDIPEPIGRYANEGHR